MTLTLLIYRMQNSSSMVNAEVDLAVWEYRNEN